MKRIHHILFKLGYVRRVIFDVMAADMTALAIDHGRLQARYNRLERQLGVRPTIWRSSRRVKP